jgi:hypothetical protein
MLDALVALSKVEKTWVDSPATVALVAGLLALLGSLITHLFNGISEKSRQNHESEIKKLESDIRKQENIQERQLEALVQLSKITYEVTPTVWSRPDYDSYDAYSEVVNSMGSLLDKLDDFLKTTSYILPQNVISNIKEVMYKCNDTHWGASLAEEPGYYEPTKNELEAAADVIDKLHSSVNAFKLKLGVTSA